jgi:hypothetical protein
MAHLTEPITGVHRSFLAAMAELRAEGRGRPGDDTMIGRGHRDHPASHPGPDG